MITQGQRIRVYYNLRKKCLSVMDKKTGLVVTHCDAINLDNVKFIVSQAGLKRVRRNQRKSVIAFVEGDYATSDGSKVFGNPEWATAYFNPYKVDQFMVGDQAIHEASRCYVLGKTIYVKDIACMT
tara:strand:+ start:94 stop:471 length:378 start_codon:yes stop_codon:yes gene_type:complete